VLPRHRASASGLSRGVNASGARAGADATAHYRNRRFYWLRAKSNTQPLPRRKENESEKERERERERGGGRGRGRGRNERNSACYHPTLAGPDNSGCTYRGSDVGGLQFLGPSRSYFVIRGAPKYSVGEFACYSDIALKRRKFITS